MKSRADFCRTVSYVDSSTTRSPDDRRLRGKCRVTTSSSNSCLVNFTGSVLCSETSTKVIYHLYTVPIQFTNKIHPLSPNYVGKYSLTISNTTTVWLQVSFSRLLPYTSSRLLPYTSCRLLPHTSLPLIH